MVTRTIKFVVEPPLATIRLSRPERLNALGQMMFEELHLALDEVEQDARVRCLVLTGEGRAFCWGQDLTADLPRDEHGAVELGPILDRDYNPLVQRLAALPVPTIAAVNGPAVGAGFNLALACDVLVAARSSYLQQAFARIGLIPDAGGTWFLTRALGPKLALATMFSAEQIPAEEAHRIGLVYRVFNHESFADDVREFALKLGSGPTAAYRAMKQAVAAAADQNLSAQLTLERDLQHRLGKTLDFEEGLGAFRSKREPHFRGN